MSSKNCCEDKYATPTVRIKVENAPPLLLLVEKLEVFTP